MVRADGAAVEANTHQPSAGSGEPELMIRMLASPCARWYVTAMPRRVLVLVLAMMVGCGMPLHVLFAHGDHAPQPAQHSATASAGGLGYSPQDSGRSHGPHHCGIACNVDAAVPASQARIGLPAVSAVEPQGSAGCRLAGTSPRLDPFPPRRLILG